MLNKHATIKLCAAYIKKVLLLLTLTKEFKYKLLCCNKIIKLSFGQILFVKNWLPY